MMSLFVVVIQFPIGCRLAAVNIGWTNMTRGAVLYSFLLLVGWTLLILDGQT